MEIFQRRTGAAHNLGVSYEVNFIAYCALRAAFDQQIGDFLITSNDAAYGDFDDAVIKIFDFQGNQVMQRAYQLKLKKNKIIREIDLLKPKDDFSLSKYCKDFSEHKDKFKSFKLMIFTNAKIQVDETKTLELKVNNETVSIKITKEKAFEDPFITNPGEIYKFYVEDGSKSEVARQYEEFFKNFYLCVKQNDSNGMEGQVKKIFFNENSYDQFLKFVQEWTIAAKDVPKLTKETVLYKAIELLLTPYWMKPPIESKFWKEITSFSEEIFLHFNLISIKEMIDVNYWYHEDYIKQISAVGIDQKTKKKYGLFDPTNTNSIKLLWHSCRIPFAISLVGVKNTQVIYNAVNLCKWKQNNRKFVMLGAVDGSLLYSSKVFNDFSDLLKSKISLNHKLRLKVQDRGPLLLEDYLQEDIEFAKCFTFPVLIKMVEENFNFGEESVEPTETYINRFVPLIFISINAVQSALNNSTFIISCNGKNIEYLSSDLKKSNENIILLENFCEPEKFRKVCSETDCQVHHLSLTEDWKFKWIESKRGVKILRQFMNDAKANPGEISIDQFTFKENEIDSEDENDFSENHIEAEGNEENEEDYVKDVNMYSHFRNKINVICADPGMGKSVMATFLKNKSPTHFWTFKIQLRDHFKFYEHSRNAKEIIDYVLKTFTKNYDKATLQLVEFLVKKKRILILWDGLDELPDVCILNVIEGVKSLEEERYHQWVTSRNYLKKQLEEEFDTFVLTMRPFNPAEQRRYISLRMGVSTDHPKVSKIIKTANDSKDKDILGIPLQIYMLTEAFKEENFPEKDTLILIDIYNKFIEKKFGFHEDKLNVNGLSFDLIERERDRRPKDYQKAALLSIFRENTQKMFGIGPDFKFLSYIQRTGDNYGFITQLNDGNVPSFAHLTYAEFFTACFLRENWKYLDKKVLREIMLEEKYKTIQYMFDMLVTAAYSAHRAVVQKEFTEVQIDSSRDEVGRTVFQLMCIYGFRHSIVTESESFNIVRFNENFEDSININIVHKQLVIQLAQDFDMEDDLPGFSLFDYCDQYQSLVTLNAIAKASNEDNQDRIKNFKHFKEHQNSFVFYCARFDYGDLFQLVSKVPFVRYSDRAARSDQVENNTTLLHTAARYCQDTRIIYKILKEDVYLEAIDGNYLGTPLQAASLYNNNCSQVGTILIEFGANVNVLQTQVPFDKSPLHLCSLTNNTELATILIGKQAYLNQPDDFNRTPLYYAMERWHKLMIKLLLQAGASVSKPDVKKVTPLHLGLLWGDENIVQLLEENNQISLDSPLFKSAITNKDETVKKLLEDTSVDPNISYYERKTLLHIYSERGNEEMVDVLIKKGASTKDKDKWNRTALNYAVDNRHRQVVKLLLLAGANPNILEGGSRRKARTPLHVYCKRGDEEIVSLLIKNGANPNLEDEDRRRPLHVAARKNRKEVAQVLLKSAADPNSLDINSRTPLHLSSEAGHEEITVILIQSEANINIQDFGGCTPLYRAVEERQKRTVKILLDAGADPNIPTERGTTPVGLSSDLGDRDIVALLVQYGAKTA